MIVPKPSYTVYVLKSLTTGKLYTGYTSDMAKRLKTHNSGHGGRFTKLNKPLELVYSEQYKERIVAIRRERELKTSKGRYFVKKLLKKKKIYFAGSIRGGRDDKELYGQIIELLSTHGEVLTEHIGDKTLSALGENVSMDYIYKRDISWLKESEIIVAEVTTPSLGVGYEIAKAEEWKKKILCIYREEEGKRISAMIGGSSGLQIIKYKKITDLRKTFEKFFAGRINNAQDRSK